MFSFKNHRVLIVAPHPDDEIFGCGGLIHRCKREGGEVHALFLTVGTTKDFSKCGLSEMSERIEEIEKVNEFMGFDSYRIAFPGNEYHLQLDHYPQKMIIDAIERGEEASLESVKPTIVLAPQVNDYNQDHRAASLALITATRPAPAKYRTLQPIVMQYELPPTVWTTGLESATMNFFLDLTDEDLEAKIAALKLYKSQLKDPDLPLSVNGVEALARMRGIQTGVKNAEAYVVRRFLV